jgi:SAM-dependent methyltransferase
MHRDGPGSPEPIARYFDEQAEHWDAEHGPLSPRASGFHACIGYLVRLCRELGRPRVLDVGCASGQHLLHLAPEIWAGVGVDLAPRMIERARAAAARHPDAGHLRFEVGDARTLSAARPGGRFGLVLFVGVLEHVPDRGRALRAAADLLDPGGRLVVVMPNRQRPAVDLRPLRRERPAAVPIFASDRHDTVRGLAARGRRAGLRAEQVEALPGPFDDRGGAVPQRELALMLARAAARRVPVTATWDTFAMRLRRADDDGSGA